MLKNIGSNHHCLKTNEVREPNRSATPLVHNMCTISLNQQFAPNISLWRSPQHRQSILNQSTAAVNIVLPNIHTVHQNHKHPGKFLSKFSSFDRNTGAIYHTTGKPDSICQFCCNHFFKSIFSANLWLIWPHSFEMETFEYFCACRSDSRQRH